MSEAPHHGGLNPRPTWLLRNERARADAELDAAATEICARGWPLRCVSLEDFEGEDFVAQLRAMLGAATEAGAERIALAGGDGTMHAFVEAWAAVDRAKLALVPLPYGTGNDLCRSLARLELPAVQQLESALLDPPRPMDLVVVEGPERPRRWMINAATIGAATRATSAASSEAKDHMGWLAYVIEGLRQAEVEPWGLRAVVDGETAFEGEALFAAVANGRTAGGGWVVAPDAWLDDGCIDLRILGADTPLSGALLEQLWERLRGLAEPKAKADSAYRQLRGRRIELHFEPTQPCNLDGESFEANPLCFEVHARALAVVGSGAAPGFEGQPSD